MRATAFWIASSLVWPLGAIRPIRSPSRRRGGLMSVMAGARRWRDAAPGGKGAAKTAPAGGVIGHRQQSRISSEHKKSAALQGQAADRSIEQSAVASGPCHQKEYLATTDRVRPRGSATRGSQPAPTTSSTLWAVNGGSVLSTLMRLAVRVMFLKPV